ncbi:kinase domain-containing [Cryptosporidium sp. chipmunk genotype I]|uniref:kinase domain-containing n=1 Tax=Cryptosporidium sp. chipmunk genotype I TaxID=1280935 RepID=UPI00351A972E|nr:kinase domain-containing [Cryptosporidium sp. chipmunk genotype I]
MVSIFNNLENIYFLFQVSPIVQIHTLRANVRYRIGPEDGITDVDISYPDPPACITTSFDLWIKNEDREFRLTRKGDNNQTESCKYFYKDCVTGSYLPIPLFPDIIVVSSGTKLRVMTSQPNECNIAFVLKTQDVSDLIGSKIMFNTEIQAYKVNSKENSHKMLIDGISNSTIQYIDTNEKKVKGDMGKSYLVFTEASLGKGGNGEVFLGLNRETFEFVAVKSEMSGSLSREADYLEKCKSDYVVRKLDWFQNRTDNREYLIMELFHGGTIRQLLRFKYKNGLPISSVRNLMYTLLVGISQMHSKGVVHRDLKTANLMLTDVVRDINTCNFQMKICDLGNSGISIGGRLKGHCCTCFATAPEVYLNNDYDEKVDIWSIGTILYELVTGQRLIECNHQIHCNANEKILRFDFSSVEKKIKEHVSVHYTFGDINWLEDVIDLLRMLLEKSPSRRISAQESLSHHFFTNYQPTTLDNSWKCTTKLQLIKILDENIPVQHESEEVNTYLPSCKCCSNQININQHFNYNMCSTSRISSSCFPSLNTFYTYCTWKNPILAPSFNKSQISSEKINKQPVRNSIIHRGQILNNNGGNNNIIYNEQNMNTQNR